ncbi:MAG: lamin tail domain-containing protein [Candidatus Saccharimonadales bacterium]
MYSIKVIGTKTISSVLIGLILLAPTVVWAEDSWSDVDVADASVLISEIQTGSEAGAKYEFVELYNRTDEDIDLLEWGLEYKPAIDGSWKNRIGASQDADRIIQANSFFLIATEDFADDNPDIDIDLLLNKSGLADHGGHLRLIKPDSNNSNQWLIVDLIGWGGEDKKDGKDADSPRSTATPEIERGSSLHRCFDENDNIVNKGDNGKDFMLSDDPRPGEKYTADDCVEPEDSGNGNGNENEGDDEDQDSDNEDENNGDNQDNSDNNGSDSGDKQPYCEGVILSELLPNPEGPRSQFPREEHAFIEIFNPTDEPIDLEGCGLQVMYVGSGSMSDIFWFDEDLTIEPLEFMAFFEQDSDLALPVGVSGKVYLLTADDIELDEIELDEFSLDNSLYEEPVPEAASWALFTDEEDYWQWTYSPTPGEANIEQDTKPLPDCEPGRERNPETSRCRNIIQEEPPPDCGPGRERNPDTNRCRNIVSASSNTLIPCKSHQERNPETNRCRNIETTSTRLVPCEPHQERNPETNRCRNVATPNQEAITDIEDVRSVHVAAPISWWWPIGILALALSYGIWEWRRDFMSLWHKLTSS